ncbi:retrovirus-related pol polyprotein from transposon TNT 1-94 [Tanacetum coccineum]
MDEGNVSLSKPSGSKVRAMKEEMSSLKKNHTWELVDQPPGQKLISCKWLYKIKEGIEGVQKPKYKARVVAWGFTQRAGIDYNEVFSHVARHTSIRVILSLTACEDYELEQLDVKTVFLHGNLEETIYMRQPPGFEEGTGNKGTADVGLVYGRDQGKHVDVDGFVDVDYAKDPDNEAEYMALTEAVKEIIWLKGLLIELGVNLRSVVVNCDNQSAIHLSRNAMFHERTKHINVRSVVVNCDNQSAIHLSRNAMFHERTKHINVRYHFIREIVKSKEIEVAKIGTKNNAADAFTKVVPGPKFKYCMKILVLGLTSLVTKVEIVSISVESS